MATHRIPILGSNTRPDASGNVYQESYDIDDTSAAISPLVWKFLNSGTKDGLRGAFVVPKNYVGTAKIEVIWNASATSGDCVFDFSYLTIADGEDCGAAATSTTDTVTTTVDGTTYYRNTSTITLTSGNFAVDDLVTFELFRDSSDAADTLADDISVFHASFVYDDA